MLTLLPAFASAVLALSFQDGSPRGGGEASIAPDVLERIRGVIRTAMQELGIPGGTVAIGMDGELAWTEGFGFADLEHDVPATADTVYRTASIGKTMTATAAMRLGERGVLDLDAKVQKYCPAFPEKPWPITARALLSHTSGIRHYEGPNVQAELFITRHYDRISDALAIFANDDLVQKPGADFHYTTWGYVVLGCVLEGAAGKDYTALMQDEVFDRAGMRDTRADDPRAIVAHRARGYVREDGVLKNSRAVDMSAKLPAGGWITTASDLVRFMNALMDGRLVRKETLNEMLTPFVLPDGGGTVDGYGLGLALSEHRGMRVGRHGGGTPQVSAFIQFVPEKRLSIAFLFNLEEIPGSKRGEIADEITGILLDAGEHRD